MKDKWLLLKARDTLDSWHKTKNTKYHEPTIFEAIINQPFVRMPFLQKLDYLEQLYEYYYEKHGIE